MTDSVPPASPAPSRGRIGKRLAAKVLLRPDGHPRRFARVLVFADQAGRPRWPLSKLLFRKNGLPRPELDEPLRNFLESVALADWVRRFDTPGEGDLARMAATSGSFGDICVLVELDEALVAAPDDLASAMSEIVGLAHRIRLLVPRALSDAEAVRLEACFGAAALLKPDVEDLPDKAVVVLAGAVPRPHGPRLLVEGLSRVSAALAYGDEAAQLPYPGIAQHWFKPSAPSPILAAQGTLVGRMVALDFGQMPQGREVAAALLRPTETRREILARLAADLEGGKIVVVPHVCHLNARPCDPPLPAILPPLPADLPVVSIIIPSRDNWSLLERCLGSLAATDWPADRLEIIVVDNDSTELDCLEGMAAAQSLGRIRVIRYPGAFNYARINNVAAAEARGALLVLLNNDTEALRDDWLKCLAAYALLPDVGAVGTKLLYGDRTVQHGGMVLGMHGRAVHGFVGLEEGAGGYQNLAVLTREVSAVTAACMAIRKEVFDAVGGFNESFAVAFNDVVLCCDLIAAGYRNCFVALPLFLHHESKSRGHNTTADKRRREADECRRAMALHPDLFAADPYYSPSLSLDVLYKHAPSPRRVPMWAMQKTE